MKEELVIDTIKSSLVISHVIKKN